MCDNCQEERQYEQKDYTREVLEIANYVKK